MALINLLAGQNRDIDVEDMWTQRGLERKGWTNWEIRIDIYTLRQVHKTGS